MKRCQCGADFERDGIGFDQAATVSSIFYPATRHVEQQETQRGGVLVWFCPDCGEIIDDCEAGPFGATRIELGIEP